MKISNNALNFLLAQYRAIFKRAYVKGIASAVILTAGLAAGQAQAAADTNGTLEAVDFANAPSDATNITITNKSKLDMKDVDYGDSGNGFLKKVTISGATVDITGAAGRHIATGDTLSIENGGKLIVTNNNQTDTHIYGGSAGTGAGITITGEGSTLTANSAAVNFGAITVEKNAIVNLGGLVALNHDLNQKGPSPNGHWWFYTNLSAVGNTGTVTVSDSTVNLRDQSHVGADKSISITGDSTVTFDGDWQDLGKYKDTDGTNKDIEGTGYSTAFIRGNSLDGKTGSVTISGTRDAKDPTKITAKPVLNVLAGRNGAIYAKTISLDATDVTIGSGGKFILDGDWVGKTLKEEGTHQASTVTLKDVTFTNSGTLVLGNSQQSGGRIDVDGKTDMQGDLDNYDNLYIPANTSAQENGYLIISENQIVQQRDESGALSRAGVWTGKYVGVYLNGASGEAVLELVGTDADGLNLNNDLQFVSQDEVKAPDDYFYADHINVTGTARIKGEHLVLTKALELRDDAQLTVDGDILELGAKDYSGATLTGLDIVGGAAHDDISLNASGDTFIVDGKIELSRDFYQKDASGDYTTTSNGFGTIRGNNLNVVSGSTIEINGGAWRNEAQGLTITSGTLTVGADDENAKTVTNGGSDGIGDPWDYVKNGNPASLTWHGAFNISGSTAAGDAKINVTGALGADSTLDLRAANVSWGSGTVTLSATGTDDGDPNHISPTNYGATAGQGILHITGSQLSNFLDLDTEDDSKTATVLNLAEGGVLLVDGTVTGPINISKIFAERTDNESNSVGTINFDSSTTTAAGWMIANGELTLVTGVDTDGENGVDTDEIAPLNIGNGTLFAEGLTLNNLNPALNEPDADLADDVIKITDGTIGVAQRLSSSNNVIHFEDSTLLLDSQAGDNNNYGLSSSEGGVVNVNQLRFTSGASFEVGTGDWTIAGTNGLGDLYFEDSSFEVGFGDEEYQRYGYTASFTADNLSYSDPDDGPTLGIDIHVQSNGALTLNTIQAPNAELTVAGTMTLNGRTDFTAESITSEPDSLQDLGVSGANTQAGIDLTGATINVNGGKFILEDTAANALVKFNVTSGAATDAVQVNTALADAHIHLNQGAEFKLNFSSGSAAAITASNGSGSVGLLAEQAKQLKSELVDTLGRGSYINVGQLALDMKYDPDTMSTTWNDVKDFVQVESDVTNDTYKQLLVKGITSSDQVAGHFGALQADLVGRNFISVDGNLGLHSARDGYFAFVDNGGTKSPIGLDLTSYSTLELDGEGRVGDITGVGTKGDNEVYFEEGQWTPGVTVVEGKIADIGVAYVNNDVQVTDSVAVGAAAITKSLEAKNVTLTGEKGISHDIDSLVTGQLTVAETLTLGNSLVESDLQIAGGEVVADTIVLNNGSQLLVGFEAQASDNEVTADFNEAANYSGRVQAHTLDLGNGGIMVDPVNSLPTALASFQQFKGASAAEKSLGTATGSLYVGRNGALGLGSENLAELEGAIAKYQQNGSLADYGSIFYLDGYMTLAAGKGITMTAQSTSDFSDYMAEHNQSLDETLTIANTVYFGDNTALKVTAEAMDAAQTANQALVTINDANGKLVSDGGEILIAGEVRAQKYTLFTDTNGGVDVVTIDGATTDSKTGITVKTENGFLVGTLDSTTGGVVNLDIAGNARAVMSGASDPVFASLEAYARGYNSVTKDKQGNITGYDYIGTPTADSDGDGINDSAYQYSNYYLAESVAQGNGAAAEAAARMGVYGGAPQAAIKAGQSSTDAIAARFGIGSSLSSLTVAGNTQGAALWLAPVYKTSDSDGFDAQGVDYGVNVDLYGVALGADFTLANGMTFGAMFNVGSGEVDGEGAASPVSNDFDYYGFGAYAGYTVGQFSVVGDISYTVADNEVEASTSVDHIGATMDSTNLSVGVTGKYELSFNGVNVTPHVGLRYSNIDLDDYTIDGEEVVASADSDKLNLFSIPVGVTIAKEFKGESWTVAPSLDLTVTGQFGDDELDSSVSWAGVENLSTSTTTEVFDNFTYGATLGVEAQSVGGVALGINVGYTSSSNVDEFGVKANARFTF